MTWWGMVLMVIGAAAALWLLAAFGCFMFVFYSATRKPLGEEEYPLPKGAVYEPFHEQLKTWMQEVRRYPHEAVSIRSKDGLTLRGSYYECRRGAPIELMMPGYRGTAIRDLCGGVHRAFSLGHNVLVVDQRGGGESDGHIITFGIRERYDCAAWVRYITERFSAEQEIILTGISMGAATVMMTTALPLPANVVGVLADCGYTSAKEIIQKVIRQLSLPVWPIYPLIRCGARLYGGFDIEAASPIEAMRVCKLPVVFVHGEADDYVPCEMSRMNYAACGGRKVLLTVPGAGHGLGFPAMPEAYIETMRSLLPCGEAVDIRAGKPVDETQADMV